MNTSITPKDVNKAIEYVSESRETHVSWINYLEDHPNYNTIDVGSIKHHLECINKYDHVLKVLTNCVYNAQM